jgi:hypothetical protein
MYRSELIIDQYTISGHTGELRFLIPWKDIVAVWRWKTTASLGLLYIGTAKGSFAIAVSNFNEKKVWNAIQTFAPTEVLGSGAYRKSLEYQKVIEANRERVENVDFPLRYLSKPWIAIAGWFLFFIFLGLTILFTFPLISGLREFHVCVIPFFLFWLFIFSLWIATILVLLVHGNVEIDPVGISLRNRLGTFHINWVEIIGLETDESSSWLIFRGERKHLSMPGVRYWSGPGRDQALSYIILKLEDQSAPIEINSMAIYKLLSKNTRIG